jgi:hypothetical protein
MPMNLLPLQIVLGFQVAAAVAIFIQLISGDEADKSLRTRRMRRVTSAKRRVIQRSLDDDVG